MPERTLKRPHRFLTMEQVRRLIVAADGSLRTIVLLAAMTGLRIGEILALRWGRIASAQRQAVDQLENQLFPSVPKFNAEEEIPGGLIQ